MNEQLQQALTELLSMIKGGLSQLPPFLKQLTTELAQYQYTSSLTWALGLSVISICMVLSIYWLVKQQLKDKTDDGVFGMFAFLAFLAWVLVMVFVGINVSNALQAKYAPTSVLIEYVTGKGGCGK